MSEGTSGAATDERVSLRSLGHAGDLGWVVMAHGQVYSSEFGWNADFEALVARIVADYAGAHAERQAAWIAEYRAERVGCVFVVAKDQETAQLRLLLVDPSARGHDIGRRLVSECVGFAREAGFQKMVLWTNHPLVAARHIYTAMGFRRTAQETHHSFGADLIGENYELDLTIEHPTYQETHS